MGLSSGYIDMQCSKPCYLQSRNLDVPESADTQQVVFISMNAKFLNSHIP